ncbi:MAG: lanthionine synthetase LanC family protein, partial [Phenylobacterium sp.]
LRQSLESETALRQIAEQPPRRFAELGLIWPAMETVLARALAKDPGDRWPSMAAFSYALSAAIAAGAPRASAAPSRPPTNVLTADYGLGGACLAEGLARGPTASLYYGAAGIAWALLRVAVLRGDPAALAAAEVWIQQALAEVGTSQAFEGPEVGITPGVVGPFALFNAEPGLHLTHALIRHAEGDRAGRQAAVAAYLRLAERACEPDAGFPLDLMNGAAGLLLGAAQLHPLCGAEVAALSRLGARLVEVLADELAAAAADHAGEAYLGLAHGEAGAVYALLRWQEVRPDDAVGATALRGLRRLAEQGRGARAGLAWPLRPGQADAWTGWCHGSAGHILLWAQAARAGVSDGALDRALRTGEFLWANRSGSGLSLCCGHAGHALSLFELGRLSGQSRWFDRGRELLAAAHQPFHPLAPHSLFRGRLGLALAQLEAVEPERSAWPVCQSPL